ncbi:DUF2949 domain-containing protein [Lyngbya confervoides]|uniref:DUF2949 domain-containing protein n=1 Tax=Lyngbya confervoides BDU141951 TaxID=1574623 RepID=A0ABD4T4W8_9CYAN|nr:DUF2949 domain-containing protein [Lyngbya confervoides]MCM1983395.1 DUF2949 domain-containing protein [Lyngbya confervoides BDU141951]
MSKTLAPQLIHYLQQELHLSEEAIALASRQSFSFLNQFPIVLWQRGLVSLEQVDQIFDWLEDSRPAES